MVRIILPSLLAAVIINSRVWCFLALSAGGCCVADCGDHVRRVLLARDARRAVRQGATDHLLQEAGEHPHRGAQRCHDAVPQSLRLTDDARHVAGCRQHRLRRKILTPSAVARPFSRLITGHLMGKPTCGQLTGKQVISLCYVLFLGPSKQYRLFQNIFVRVILVYPVHLGS